jgi:hypothetical protein
MSCSCALTSTGNLKKKVYEVSGSLMHYNNQNDRREKITESCKIPLDEFQLVGTSRRYRIPSNEPYISLSKVKYMSTNSRRRKGKRYD